MAISTSDRNELIQAQKRSNTVLAILAAIAFAFATAPAYSQAMITAGFENRPHLADGGDSLSVVLPAGKSAQQLVGLGVDISNTGYFWWSDGTVTQGSGNYAADLAGAQRYHVPFGKRVSEIVGIAIDKTGEVYTYFNDYTVSIGDPFDLDAIDRPRPYLLPVGYVPNDIIGVGMLDDDVVLFFRDGTHHYTDVDDYRNFTITAPDYESSTFTVPSGFTTSNIAGMDFADADGRLYTMFVTPQQPNNQHVQPASFTQSRTRRTTSNGISTTSHSTTYQGFTTANNGITISKGDWSLTLPTNR